MKFLITSFLILVSFCSVAQRHIYIFRTIVGMVSDKNGRPLNDCTVLFAGTGMGSTTDEKGEFKLHFPDETIMITLYNHRDDHKYYFKVAPGQNALNIRLDNAAILVSDKNLAEYHQNQELYNNRFSQAVQSEEFYEYVHHGEHRRNDDVTIDEPVAKVTRDTDPDQIYTSAEKIPSFHNSTADWLNYLKKNLKYPEKARQDNTQGKVFLIFVVEKDGRITDIRIVRSLSPECDQEAVRLIRDSGRWQPATQDGKPVRFMYSYPITFQL